MQEPKPEQKGLVPSPPPDLPELPYDADEEQPGFVSNAEVYQERRHFLGRAFLGCGLVVLLAVVIIGLLPTLLGLNILDSVVSSLRSVMNPEPSVARVTSTQTILTGIQPLGQLVTVSAQLAKAEINVSVRAGGLNACGFSTDHVAQGTIEGGVNLAEITEGNISYDTTADLYTVRVPAAELTSCRVDFIRQYNRSTTICNVDWDEARLIAQHMALEDFRNDAIEGGILDRAELEARLVLSNFIGALTGSNVQIVFEEPETTNYPASCVPETPDGWVFDESENAWRHVP